MEYFEGGTLKDWFLNFNINLALRKLDENSKFEPINEDIISKITPHITSNVNAHKPHTYYTFLF